jgi:hypothetical protein
VNDVRREAEEKENDQFILVIYHETGTNASRVNRWACTGTYTTAFARGLQVLNGPVTQ